MSQRLSLCYFDLTYSSRRWVCSTRCLPPEKWRWAPWVWWRTRWGYEEWSCSVFYFFPTATSWDSLRIWSVQCTITFSGPRLSPPVLRLSARKEFLILPKRRTRRGIAIRLQGRSIFGETGQVFFVITSTVHQRRKCSIAKVWIFFVNSKLLNRFRFKIHSLQTSIKNFNSFSRSRCLQQRLWKMIFIQKPLKGIHCYQ